MEGRRALDFVQPHWRDLDPYEAAEPPELLAERAGISEEDVVKLNANENPYGPSPKVFEALAQAHRVHVYPDPAQVAMRKALAGYTGIGAEHIVVGNGSDEIIDLVFRAVLAPGDCIVNSPPTFGMYDVTARICGASVIEVERDEHFALDVDGVLAAAAQAKIIVLASPNNPSGNATPAGDIERLLDSPCVVVVDEAYAEFNARSVANLVIEHPNLVVLRTMSKWAGLAGLRVGYGMMAADMADVLMRGKPPYNVSQAAEGALLASLADRANSWKTASASSSRSAGAWRTASTTSPASRRCPPRRISSCAVSQKGGGSRSTKASRRAACRCDTTHAASSPTSCGSAWARPIRPIGLSARSERSSNDCHGHSYRNIQQNDR